MQNTFCIVRASKAECIFNEYVIPVFSPVSLQLLAVILQTGPGNPKKKKQLDLSEVCASIRCQKSEQACLEMATIFDDYLDDLDFEPTSKAFARLYNIMDDSDEEWPVTPVHIKPISQRKMYKMLALLDLTLGNEIKLRHGGGGFSTFSLGERTRRLSVNLQEYERNQGLFGVAVKTGGTVGGPALDPLTEETGSDADSKPPDAFITDVDKSLPPSRPGSTSSRPGSTTSKREVSSALRRPQQGNKKLNSLFAIDKYDPVWVKAAKLTLLEDEFKEMVMEDVLLLKLWNDVDTNQNGNIGLGEWLAFVNRRYPIIEHKKPMNAAFLASAQNEGDELFKAGGTAKAKPNGERVLFKRDFKTFLQLVIKMARLWYAWVEIDTDDVRGSDDRVNYAQYKKGRRAFRGVLKMDNDVTVEKEILAEFQEMDEGHADGVEDGEEDGLISWTTVSEWWLARVEEEVLPWIPDPELDASLNTGKTFDFSSLQDLVVHCHYVTRVATSNNNN